VKLSRLSIAIGTAMMVVACASHPPARVQPRMPAPDVEPQTDAWWKSFHDPELDSLVARAVAANYDLKSAAARVEEARAVRGGARSDYLPHSSASVSATRNRLFTVVPQPFAVDTSIYRVAFDTAWEVDVFGRVRGEVDAATSELVASEQDRRNVLVSLLGDVGRNYTDLRGLQARRTIADQNIAAAQVTVSLTRALAQAGQATEREVAQAQAQLESLRSQIPGLETSIQFAIHRLGVLLGGQPDALQAELASPASIPLEAPAVPVGLPSDLLERRPDVLRSRAQLAAAHARVGEARADYFPRFTLLGTAGRQASQLHDLRLGLGNFFSIGPTVSLPLFSRGRIRSNVAVQEARVTQAEDAFQSTVLTSLEETENALVAYAREQERRDRLEAAVRASQTAVDLATVQYRAGLTDFLTVLQAQRDLYTNQDLLAASQTAIATNLVALYKALAGGWPL